MVRGKKTKKVLDHLKSGRTITQQEATILYGTSRLSSIIFNLRGEGFPIETEMISVKDRFGDKCEVAKYKMVETP